MVLVSVIIPTYGTPDLLESAIKSVLEQTFQDFELIIVDDNNPNTVERKMTEDLVRDYVACDQRINYICHERNKNGAAARNTGINAASGQYISFLDSDDEYLPSRLEKCVNALENNNDPNCKGVYTGCEFRRKGKKYFEFIDVKDGRFLKDTLSGNFNFCTGSNIFVHRNVLMELNGFDETFLRHQDYEFLVRFFEKYSLIAIKEVLVIKNNDNKNLPSPDHMSKIKKQYLEKYEYIITSMKSEEQKNIYKTQNVLLGEAYLNEKLFSIASEYYRKASSYGSIGLKYLVRRILLSIRATLKEKGEKKC